MQLTAGAPASMTNHLAPVVAVVLGVAAVDERLSWNLVGTAVVLLGVWIAEHNPDERGAATSDTLVRQRTARPKYGNPSDSTWVRMVVGAAAPSDFLVRQRTGVVRRPAMLTEEGC